MDYSIVNSLPEAEWADFVQHHPDGNIFHTPDMFTVFKQTKGYTPELWAATNNEGILVLFLPVHISLNSGLASFLTTRSIIFGGVLVNPKGINQGVLENLLHAYQQSIGHRSVFSEIRNVFPCPHIQPELVSNRFFYEDHLNYLIDLDSSPENVFNQIGHRTQRNIRHALNQGKVSTKEIFDEAGVIQSYQLIRKTYANAKVPLADQSLFESAFDILSKKQMIQITTSFVDQKPAATSIELLYKKKVFGWYGGMDRAFRSFVPNEVLMWHILRTFCEKGFQQYDFGGAGKPSEKYGVRDFKAKFGGNLVNFGRNTWIPSEMIFQLSRTGFAAYRKLLTILSSPAQK